MQAHHQFSNWMLSYLTLIDTLAAKTPEEDLRIESTLKSSNSVVTESLAYINKHNRIEDKPQIHNIEGEREQNIDGDSV